MFYFQSMHNEALTKRKTPIKSKFTYFLQIFSSSHTISIILYSYIFRRNFFLIIFNTVYRIIFFIQYSKIYFFEENEQNTHFQFFSIFYYKQNIVLFFYKETKLKTSLFCLFFFRNSIVQTSKNQFS